MSLEKALCYSNATQSDILRHFVRYLSTLLLVLLAQIETTVKHFERRTRTRLRLRLPILLLKGEAETPLWTETTDISNNGFYCNIAQPFAPGDELKCLIVLPTHAP